MEDVVFFFQKNDLSRRILNNCKERKLKLEGNLHKNKKDCGRMREGKRKGRVFE